MFFNQGEVVLELANFEVDEVLSAFARLVFGGVLVADALRQTRILIRLDLGLLLLLRTPCSLLDARTVVIETFHL